MARAPRLNFPDGVYHVTSRGNGRARIVYSDDDRERFERQLRDNVETYGILLYAWVLMDNIFRFSGWASCERAGCRIRIWPYPS